MNLEANASRAIGRDGQRGYAMAALLVAMAVMAILMTAALPTWKQMAQREKEEELIFRGTQYARAIGAYQRKYANASPPTIDVLLEQHFLRKKYKDPVAITEDGEFALLYVNNQAPGAPGTGRQGTQGTQPGGGSSAGLMASTTPSGNIIGVASKNPAASLRTYNDHTHYNEWQFMALQQTTTAGPQGAGGSAGRGRGDGGSGFVPGGAAGGRGGAGQQGTRGGGPGGPGGPGGRGGGGPGGQGAPPPGGLQGFPQGGGRGGR